MNISFKDMETVLMRELRLYHHPIAVRLLPTEDALKEFSRKNPHVIPATKLTFCQWEIAARMAGQTVVGRLDRLGCLDSQISFGLRLPDDFGTAPLRPAGENNAPVRVLADFRWNGHLFVAVDARWVLYDITLDGNTFKSSHSVDKRPFVADVGYGIAVHRGHWRFAFARYHRSREFDGQHEVPVYGTVTLGRHF